MPAAFPGTSGDYAVANSGSANATSITVSKPTNVADNDLLVAAVYGRSNTAQYTTIPTGWTAVDPSGTRTTSTGWATFFYKAVPTASAETATSYTWSGGASGRHTAVIIRVTGADLTTPIDNKSADAQALAGTPQTLNIPTQTTTTANALYLSLESTQTGTGLPTSSFTPPAGVTKIADTSTSTSAQNNTLGMSFKQLSAAGAVGANIYSATNTVQSGLGYAITIVSAAPSNQSPTANAGSNQSGVAAGATVTLNGSGSSDPDGTIASYNWTQISGTTVTLSGSGANRTFTAPSDGPGSLTFGLTVTDNGGATSSQSTVTIGYLAPAAGIAFRDSASASGGSTVTSLTITRPGTVQVGDYGIIIASAGHATGPATVPSGWTTLPGLSDVVTGSTAGRFSVFVRQHVAGDANPLINYASAPASGNNSAALAVWYSGVSSINAGSPSVSTSASSTWNAPSITTTGTNSKVLAISGMKASSSLIPTSATWAPDAGANVATRYPIAAFYPGMVVADFNKPTPGATNIQTATWDQTIANAFAFQLELSGSSNLAPTANAGANQSGIEPFTNVTLTGSGSTDPDGSIVSYSWAQVSGPTVTLAGSAATRTFVAPNVVGGATLSFELTVTDNLGATSSPATTTVTVLTATEAVRVAGVWSARRIKRRSSGAWV